MFSQRNSRTALLPVLVILFLFYTKGQTAASTDTNTTASPAVTNSSLSTQLNSSSAVKSHRPCDSDNMNFCLNGGQCIYYQDRNEPSCQCQFPFGGERCGEIATLTVKRHNSDQLIGVIVGILMLVFALVIILACCFLKRFQGALSFIHKETHPTTRLLLCSHQNTKDRFCNNPDHNSIYASPDQLSFACAGCRNVGVCRNSAIKDFADAQMALQVVSAVLTSPRVSTDVSYAGDAFDPEHGGGRPLVAKRSILSCDTSFDHYCLNNGQCMFLVDLNESHCKCEQGYLGSRCEHPQFVVKPMKQEELALIIICVVLMILGLAGALYFFCKWYRRKQLPQQQKRMRYTAVQIA